LSYTKNRLDGRSLQTVLNHPCALKDSLARALVQGAAWDMTRDAQMAARDFIRLGLAALPEETESAVRQMWLSQVQTAAAVYTDPAHRSTCLDDVATALLGMLVAAEPGSGSQLQLVQACARMGAREDYTADVRGLRVATTQLAGRPIGSESRWTEVAWTAAAGRLDVAEVDEELRQGQAAAGRERAVRVRAASPAVVEKAGA